MSVTNIRKGIYETNSSSVHVLCINTKSDIEVPKSFTFPRGGEYGWECESYNDPFSCAQYFYLILKDYAYTKVCKEFRDSPECKELEKTKGSSAYFYPELCEKYKQLIVDYTNEYKQKVEDILNNAGCHNIEWEEDPEFVSSYSWEKGYIDHVNQAYDFFIDLITTPDLLIHFLFGGGSIHTGNDNDEYDDPSCDPDADYEYTKGN